MDTIILVREARRPSAKLTSLCSNALFLSNDCLMATEICTLHLMHGFVNLMSTDVSRTGWAIYTSCASGQKCKEKVRCHYGQKPSFMLCSEKAFGRKENNCNLIKSIVTERGSKWKKSLKTSLALVTQVLPLTINCEQRQCLKETGFKFCPQAWD